MIKFLTEPKNFTNPDGTTITVNAISVFLCEQDISYTPAVKLKFSFYKKEIDNSFTELSSVIKPMCFKKVTIPNIGDIDFISGLVSYDKTKVYQVANLFALQNGYTLLPLKEQTDLQLL